MWWSIKCRSLVSYRIWKVSNKSHFRRQTKTKSIYLERTVSNNRKQSTVILRKVSRVCKRHVLGNVRIFLWVAGRCANLVADTGQASVWKQNNVPWTSLLQQFWDCHFESANKANANYSPVNTPNIKTLKCYFNLPKYYFGSSHTNITFWNFPHFNLFRVPGIETHFSTEWELYDSHTISVAWRSKAFGSWDPGFKYRWGHEHSSVVFVVCCVRIGLCDVLITSSDESYRVSVSEWECVCVCV